MTLELIKTTVTNMLGGAVNLDEFQLAGLINQAIQQISAMLTPERAPRLVARAHLVDPAEVLPALDGSPSVSIGAMEGDDPIGDEYNLEGWFQKGQDNDDEAMRDDTIFRDGLSSCRLRSDYSWIRAIDPTDTLANRKYTYSFWAKAAGDADTYYTVHASFSTYDADGESLDDHAGSTDFGDLSTTAFVKHRGEVTFDSNVDHFKMRFSLKDISGSAVTPDPSVDYVNIDDVSLLSSMYALPEDSHGNIFNLYIDGVSAELVPPNRIQEITGDSNQFVAPGSVSPVYAIEGDKIIFGPSSATRVEALYLKKPKELVQDTDECDLPNDVQALIFPLVAYYGALSNGSYEDAQLHQAGYVTSLQSLGLVTQRGPENA